MTAKKDTQAKAEAKRNPFDEAYEGTKNTRNEQPKNVETDKKTTPEVIESAPENVGTQDAKLDVDASATAKIDADKADEANKQAEAEKKAQAADEKKSSGSTRRTKEEKKADDIAAAKTLLEENGYRTSEVSDEDETPDTVEHESDVDFNTVDFEKLPLSAVSGTIAGTIGLNQGAVPILSIGLTNWIGEPPVSIAASQLGDVEFVIKELKKQAKKAKA